MPFSIDEIKKRKTFQWTAGYLVTGFGALQLLDYIGNSFHWPETVKRVATILYIGGILVTLVLSWFHGEKGEQRITPPELAMLTLILLVSGVAIRAAAFRHEELLSKRSSDVVTNSVVVLPFANRSANAQDEYFSDGISEELLDALARVPNLHVPARTSAFSFKNKNLPTPQIAKQLGVHYVLEGSVERAGDVVRIKARLIDGPQDRTVWEDQFERTLKDVFAVEDEISRTIAVKLRLRLVDSGAGARTENPEAHELYLRGRYLLSKSTTAALKESWSYFERAIDLDSTYAAAYGGLAEAYTLSAADKKTGSMFDKALALARKSITLDERQSEVHAVLGALLLWRDWNLTGAEREFKRAIEINPNEANTYDYHAWVFQMRGQSQQAVSLTQEAVRIDPFSTWLSYALEFRYVNNHMYDEAIKQHAVTQQLDPDQFYWDLPVAEAYREKHQYNDAVREYLAIQKRIGDQPLHGLAITYARMGKKAEAEKILTAMLAKADTSFVPPEQIALVYANLGVADQAFKWLDKAFNLRDGWLSGWIDCDPSYDPLRNDPRFNNLLSRIRTQYR